MCAVSVHVSIGCDTPSLASRITLGSVTPTVPVEVEMGEDCDCGCRIMHDDEHPHSDDYSDIDDDTLETNKSTHENDKLTPSSKIDLEVMAERQQKLNSFLLPHNTELLEQQGPLLSDLQHKIKMAQPKRYCGNA